jgi:hypothetical protein
MTKCWPMKAMRTPIRVSRRYSTPSIPSPLDQRPTNRIDISLSILSACVGSARKSCSRIIQLGELRGPCPIHSKECDKRRRHFAVNPEKNVFQCFQARRLSSPSDPRRDASAPEWWWSSGQLPGSGSECRSRTWPCRVPRRSLPPWHNESARFWIHRRRWHVTPHSSHLVDQINAA